MPVRIRKVLQFLDRWWSLGEERARWMQPIAGDDALDSNDHVSSEEDEFSSDSRSRCSEMLDEKLLTHVKTGKISTITPESHDNCLLSDLSEKPAPLNLADIAAKAALEGERLRRTTRLVNNKVD